MPAGAEGLLHRRHRLPAERREQPDGGLLDELVFGVGVGHGSGGGLDVDLAREQARQQQVAGAAEVLDLAVAALRCCAKQWRDDRRNCSAATAGWNDNRHVSKHVA